MTAHQLAKKLLKMRDVTVYVTNHTKKDSMSPVGYIQYNRNIEEDKEDKRNEEFITLQVANSKHKQKSDVGLTILSAIFITGFSIAICWCIFGLYDSYQKLKVSKKNLEESRIEFNKAMHDALYPPPIVWPLDKGDSTYYNSNFKK